MRLSIPLLILLSLPLHAGTVLHTCPPTALDTFTLDESNVFGSPVRFSGGKKGTQSAHHITAEYIRRVPLQGPWHLEFGLRYDAFHFGGRRPPAGTPGALQAASLPIGVSYMVDNHAGFLFRMNPGGYFENHVRANAFDMPIEIGTYVPLKEEKLYWVLGVGTSILRHYHVVPVTGVIWVINEKWQLMGYLPEPKLVYQVNDRLRTWVGAEICAGSYRTDPNPAALVNHGQTTSGSVVDYSEIRVGLGVEWQPREGWTLLATAGYSVERAFDFYRVRRTALVADPAPYVRVAFNAAF